MRSPARKTTASLRPLGLPATRCCTQACQQIATLACQRVHDRRRQARAHRTGPGQRVPVSVALSALGTVLVADRKPETKPRTGNSPIYRPSTRSRRSPGDSVRLRVRHAASDRDGADGSVHAEHRSPLSSRFLNRVRRSDSCRGHYERPVIQGLSTSLMPLSDRVGQQMDQHQPSPPDDEKAWRRSPKTRVCTPTTETTSGLARSRRGWQSPMARHAGRAPASPSSDTTKVSGEPRGWRNVFWNRNRAGGAGV